MKRCTSDAIVTQNAVTLLSSLDIKGRLQTQFFERTPFVFGISRHLFQLHAVIKGKGFNAGPIPSPICGPMHLFQLRIIAQIGARNATFKEELKLLPAGISGCASMPTDGKGATSICVF